MREASASMNLGDFKEPTVMKVIVANYLSEQTVEIRAKLSEVFCLKHFRIVCSTPDGIHLEGEVC